MLQVLQEALVDAKNTCVPEGTRQPAKQKGAKRQQKLTQALNKAKQIKNEARRELRKARANDSLAPDHIRSLARKFLQSVRSHNGYKRAVKHAGGTERPMQPDTTVIITSAHMPSRSSMITQPLTLYHSFQRRKQQPSLQIHTMQSTTPLYGWYPLHIRK